MQKKKYSKFYLIKKIYKDTSINSKPLYGSAYIKILKSGFLSPQEVEATRRVVRKKLNKKGRLVIRVFPTLGSTSKGIGARMGKGKGSLSKTFCKVKRGQILLEIEMLDEKGNDKSYNILSKSLGKLSLKTKAFKRAGL